MPPEPPPPEPPPRSSSLRAAPAAERIHAIDVVRGAALAGVLLANLLGSFREPTSRAYLAPDDAGPVLDRWVEGFVQFAIQGKAITLFSVLFGVGLAIQYERFSRLGNPRYWLARRLLVLLAVGVAHLALLWNGDILTEYALAGLLVLPLLGLPSRTLVRIAVALYVFYVVAPSLPFMPEWPDDTILAGELADALRIYGSGTYEEIRRYSWHEWRVFSPIYLSLFTVTPALFLAGVVIWRSGVLRQVEAHRERLVHVALVGLAAGAILTAVSLDVGPTRSAMMASFLAAGVAPAVFAAGYGASLLLLALRGWAPALLRAFAAGGRMAFTNYLVQSAVFTTLFFGYGFGLMDRIGAAAAFAWGLAAYAAQLAFSRWWLARFRFGPLEWAWRSLTYGSAQPM